MAYLRLRGQFSDFAIRWILFLGELISLVKWASVTVAVSALFIEVDFVGVIWRELIEFLAYIMRARRISLL